MKNILIIDDEEDFHRIIKRVLEKENYKIASAFSGEEAFRILEIFTPDLIICDWNLPGISGIEIVKNLRKMNKFKTIPIIMYTIRDGEEDKLNAYSTDIQFYLTKPVKGEILLAKIKYLLKNH